MPPSSRIRKAFGPKTEAKQNIGNITFLNPHGRNRTQNGHQRPFLNLTSFLDKFSDNTCKKISVHDVNVCLGTKKIQQPKRELKRLKIVKHRDRKVTAPPNGQNLLHCETLNQTLKYRNQTTTPPYLASYTETSESNIPLSSTKFEVKRIINNIPYTKAQDRNGRNECR